MGSLLVLAFAHVFAVPVFAATTDDLRALVESSQSAQAYELGRAHPEEFGRGEFDFYFGISAIDAGHAGEGVLALERYLLQFPENTRARLELARGYFVLGELPRAREEFNAVAQTNPPPNVLATIDRFMDAIRAQESRYQPAASAYVELGGGLDTNVNSGIGGTSVNVPTLGNVQLPSTSTRQGDRFLHVGAGGQYTRPIMPGVALFGGATYEGKFNAHSDLTQFNLQSLALYGGASRLRDRDLMRGTLSYSTLAVSESTFRDVVSAGGEWQRQVSELSQFSLNMQLAALRYPSSDIRNADFRGLGVGWRQSFVHSLQPVLQLQAVIGLEDNPVRNDLSRAIRTLRAVAGVTPAPRWALSAGISLASSAYLGTDPVYLKSRDDTYVGADLGVSYRIDKRITVRGEFNRSTNASSLSLYSYDRNVAMCKLRYEFK